MWTSETRPSRGWAPGFYGSALMALIAAVMAVRLRSQAAALKAAKLQAAALPG